MKKALKYAGIIFLLMVAFVLVAGLFVKKNYHLERSVSINATHDSVWNYVCTLSNMQKWSPWLDLDPHVQTSIQGTDGTAGAVYTWNGNKDVGSGTQTITKIQPQQLVETHLHFLKPVDGEADTFTRLVNEAGATKVTWVLTRIITILKT